MGIINSFLISGKISSNSVESFALFEKERFGEKTGEKISYLPVEAIFLVEHKKMKVFDAKEKEIKLEEFIGHFEKKDKNLMTRYLVFKDLRKKGNIVKSALKFGGEFRVYEPGSSLGEDHARWILFCLTEHDKILIREFSAKNRVAHSANKKLLIAIVDDEEDISYYETRWLRL